MTLDQLTSAIKYGLAQLSTLSPELAAEAQRLDATLQQPPRIVFVGRLKAGKSTLVNALIGAPVAETAALEATNVVTVYQNGSPDRAEAKLKNGQRIPITTRRGEAIQLPVPAEEISYITRWMPTAALDRFTLIDTPGLATLTTSNEQATRRALIDGFEQTRDASVDADAAVFLFEASPRNDEVDFIKRLGFTSLNTLGVLSRADSFGQGSLGDHDPLEEANSYAVKLSRELRKYFFKVIPIAGLLAETAYTGALRESDARQAAEFSSASLPTLIRLLRAPAQSELHSHDKLHTVVSKIGEYGLFRGRSVAPRGAAALNEWMAEKSGVPGLVRIFLSELSRFATTHRAIRIIKAIEELGYKYPQFRPQIRSIVSMLRNDNRLLEAVLLADLKALTESDARQELIDEVTTVLRGLTPLEKLGLDTRASGFDIIERVRQKKIWAQEIAWSLPDPAEEAALITLQRAYARLEGYGQSLT